MPFGRKKKKLEISSPTNFEHRVHTGFDRQQGVFVGLPSQWNGIINVDENKDRHRPKPIVDASRITQNELGHMKVGAWF
jgi:hypothetical protein